MLFNILLILIILFLPQLILWKEFYNDFRKYQLSKKRAKMSEEFEERHKSLVGFCNLMCRLKLMTRDDNFKIVMNEISRQQFEFERLIRGLS